MVLRLSSRRLRSRAPRSNLKTILVTEIISYQPQDQMPVTSNFWTTLALREQEQELTHQPAAAWQRPTRSKQSGGPTGTQTRSNASIHLFINALGHQAQATAGRDRTRTAAFLMLTPSRSNHTLFYLEMNTRPCRQLFSVSSAATGRRISTIETSWNLLILMPYI